jgi:putative addiction module CopG family antidote
MNIILKPEQEQFIQEEIKNGRYETVEQVISEALKLLEEYNRQRLLLMITSFFIIPEKMELM